MGNSISEVSLTQLIKPADQAIINDGSASEPPQEQEPSEDSNVDEESLKSEESEPLEEEKVEAQEKKRVKNEVDFSVLYHNVKDKETVYRLTELYIPWTEEQRQSMLAFNRD